MTLSGNWIGDGEDGSQLSQPLASESPSIGGGSGDYRYSRLGIQLGEPMAE